MPLDRRVIVQLETEGYRDPDLQGEYVPGEITALSKVGNRARRG